MPKIALLFDRTYIDAHHCFMELADQLASCGFGVDLYMINNSYNHQPFFEKSGIRIFSFPFSKFEKMEYWSRIFYSKDRKYSAIIATPVMGAWVAYKTAKIQKIPFYYLADELVEHLLSNIPPAQKARYGERNYIANKKAAATIALGEERYKVQQQLNRIDYPHEHFVIPNAPAGDTVRIRSNYFRDLFNIEDRKPILLFAGTLSWILAKKIYEESKTYSDRGYHLVFHARTLGQMGENNHPFIRVSTIPIPSTMMNYVVSSADIGLALYDKNSDHETRNGFTGGKIGTYLKNELPLIAGSAENLRFFEEGKVGTYWDGEADFDKIAISAIHNMEMQRKNIREFYRRNLQYDVFFKQLKDHLLKSIKHGE